MEWQLGWRSSGWASTIQKNKGKGMEEKAESRMKVVLYRERRKEKRRAERVKEEKDRKTEK